MLILFTLILLAIGVALMMNVYSIFSPFIENLGDIKNYNIAYYGALGSVERAELALKYHSAGFEGSGGWLDATNNFGAGSDGYFENFSKLSDIDSSMGWQITSRVDGYIPKPDKGNVPPALRGTNSEDYNTLKYIQAQEFAISMDTTKTPSYYYNDNTDPNPELGLSRPNSIEITLRLPDKIKSAFGANRELFYNCAKDLYDYCDLDDNSTVNDNIVLRSLFGTNNNP